MIKTMMVIITAGAIYEAMFMVKFASYLTLELFVSFELCRMLIT
jgi:hypothetical protein